MKSKVVQFDYTRNVPMCAKIGGVQLWENGPYWAECNIGATKPEEPGYYFWWGETVGYKPEGGTIETIDEDLNCKCDVTWVSVKDGTILEFDEVNHPTYHKSNSQLQDAGYIDSTGNLAAAHDAAAACCGDGWRMPTAADFGMLKEMCKLSWTTCNGVKGYLVTGKGAYASKSIFLPAAGCAYDSCLFFLGSVGAYWSSTPDSDDYDYALHLYLCSDDFELGYGRRVDGKSVRPVRGCAK